VLKGHYKLKCEKITFWVPCEKYIMFLIKHNKKIGGFKAMIYICSPLRANKQHTLEQNVERAKRICRVCSLKGILVMAVHLYFPQFLDDNIEEERNCGIQHGITMLGMCNEMWVFGEIMSSGMRAEIEYAEANNIPIKYYKDIDELIRSIETY